MNKSEKHLHPCLFINIKKVIMPHKQLHLCHVLSDEAIKAQKWFLNR